MKDNIGTVCEKEQDKNSTSSVWGAKIGRIQDAQKVPAENLWHILLGSETWESEDCEAVG